MVWLRLRSVLALGPFFAAACGGGGSPAQGPAPAQETGRTLTGFDADGQRSSCEAPREQCPETKANPDFTDRCRLSGFRVIRCGCDDVCSGNVAKSDEFFDKTGSARNCEPERSGCTPPETSAKFQDACTDARHKLVVCGCEWLCNGPLAPSSSSSSE